jgi:hypothetical protein
MASQPKIVLGFFAARHYEIQSLILAKSLRTFGGEYADLPIWIMVPEQQPLQGPVLDAIKKLNVEIIPFLIDPDFRKFPFAGKAMAAAVAEERAAKEGALLAWHDRTGFIHHTPFDFNLIDDIAVGFRPTDIANIGALYNQPIPPFWQTVMDHFHLHEDDFPPITTAIDRKKLHLYVNAGLLVVRPEKKLLQTWATFFQETYNLQKFKSFYQENQAYAIFMHQAALSAAMIKRTNFKERAILPNTYLFSVDNFFDYTEELRPGTLDQVTTGRFHDFFALPDWQVKIIASPKLIDWFKTQLEYGPYWPENE